ncbi:MAG: hypothetical protein FIA96_11300 [Betaproteobacteria bacterium]|nr:hypothetical protein [Betaproteobacteria bacterium]
MNESIATSSVIPLKLVQGDSAIKENLTRRLESEGWIRQSTIGEPHLSAMVRTYERLGYEVRIEANQDSVASDSVCSSGGASGCSGGATTGCSGGGCSSGGPAVNFSVVPIPVDDEVELRTLFVRKAVRSGN